MTQVNIFKKISLHIMSDQKTFSNDLHGCLIKMLQAVKFVADDRRFLHQVKV